MQLNPSEISELIKSRIQNLGSTLEARLHNTTDMELRNSLAQVGEIARLRLAAMTS